MAFLLVFSDGVPIQKFAGIIISVSDSNGCAKILTSSEIVCNHKGKLLSHKVPIKLAVCACLP
jgi:hypothetical protein